MSNTKLFGIDIAKIVHDNLKGGLLPGTLTRYTAGTRTPGQVTGGLNPTTTVHTFEGIFEEYSNSQIDGTRVVEGDRKVLIIAESIDPLTVPQTGDDLVLEGDSVSVVKVGKDPANATYVCQVRS